MSPTAVNRRAVDSLPFARAAILLTLVTVPLFAVGAPDLRIAKFHLGSFTQGDVSRSFTISVSNFGGGATTDEVSVTDTLPAGLNATSIDGSGWNCALNNLTCTRNDELQPNDIWPPILVTVSVEDDAPYSVINTATVSGGGDVTPSNNTASDRVAINASQNCAIFNAPFDKGVGSEPLAIAAGDFDADGQTDLATLHEGVFNVLLRNADDGSFKPPVPYSTGSTANGLAAGDFDEDGDDDLAISRAPDQLTIFLFENGEPAAGEDYTVGTSPMGVIASDLDGDGSTDLAVADFDSDTVSFLIGDGDGTFAAPFAVPVGGGPLALAAADLTADGLLDLAVVCHTTSRVTVLVGQPGAAHAVFESYAVGSGPTSIAIADFDNDGDADLAVGALNFFTLSILLGNGQGAFGTAMNSTNPAMHLAASDFNGDGNTDLALAGGFTESLRVLAGQGDGTFAAGTGWGAPGFPNGVTISDFNADGKPDAALSLFDGGRVSVHIGGCPDLTVTKTHVGSFTQGQEDATYTVTITNSGDGPTVGQVFLEEMPPGGLYVTGMSGAGWGCAVEICERSHALLPGESYPITVTVSVSASAPANLTNIVVVSGGSDFDQSNNEATDPTTIIPIADLTITKTHVGNFAQGQTGRTYTIVVTNYGGGTTTGTVTVADQLPGGLTATSMSGAGWSCGLNPAVCTRNDALGFEASYPPITVVVTVGANAPAAVTNVATVSGGGDETPDNNTVADPTTILVKPTNVVAVAISTSQTSVTWSPVNAATNYQVYRRSNGGPLTLVGFPFTNSFNDTGLTPDTTYLYYVHATDASNVGLASSPDWATTTLFADDPIVPLSTSIKASHFTQLRTAVNAARATAGLPAASFTDAIAVGVPIKSIHVTELRARLDEARAAAGLPALTYTDPSLAGIAVATVHVRQLRNGLK